MANLDLAAVELLKLLGLLDKDGTFQLTAAIPYILSPKDNLAQQVRANRARIDEIVKQFIDENLIGDYPYETIPGKWTQSPDDPPKNIHGNKTPPNPDDEEKRVVLYHRLKGDSTSTEMNYGAARTNYVVTNSVDKNKEESLSIGLGVNYYWQEPSQSDATGKVASIYLPLIGISSGNDVELIPAELDISGDVPSPDFLPSIHISVRNETEKLEGKVEFIGKRIPEDNSEASIRNAQTYTYTLGEDEPWSAVRLGTFCLVEWIAKQADHKQNTVGPLYADTWRNRAYHYLLKSLGYYEAGKHPAENSTTEIQPTPLFDFRQKSTTTRCPVIDFSKWWESICVAPNGTELPKFFTYLLTGLGVIDIPTVSDPQPNGNATGNPNRSAEYQVDGPPVVSALNDKLILRLLPLKKNLKLTHISTASNTYTDLLLLGSESYKCETLENTGTIKCKIDVFDQESIKFTEYSNTNTRRIFYRLGVDSGLWMFVEWAAENDESHKTLTYGVQYAPSEGDSVELKIDLSDDGLQQTIHDAVIFGLTLAAHELSADNVHRNILLCLANAIGNKPADAVAYLITALGATNEDTSSALLFELAEGITVSADVDKKNISTSIALAQVGNIKNIDKLQADASIDLGKGTHNTSLTLQGLRLGKPDTGADADFKASLLPDFSDMPGINLKLEEKHNNEGTSWSLNSSGTIAVQRKVGPIELSSLTYSAQAGTGVRNPALTIKLDSQFELGPIFVKPYGLGLKASLKDELAAELDLTLDGLAVSLDTSAFGLEGMLRRSEADGIECYDGAAMLRIAGLGGISAFGGFGKVDSSASLYVFAALNAPLGGPPFFFVTGLAGGFGYNRQSPQGLPLSKHPFIAAIEQGSSAIQGLAAGFSPAEGNHWFAAGVKFRSLGLIEGIVVAVAAFGHDLHFQILGRGRLDLGPLLSLGIDIQASASSESMQVRAGVSSDSYLLHPDFIRPEGDMGLGTWYGGSQYAGDFYFSVGGFLESARKEHYPSLNRIGMSARLLGFVDAKGGGFFALTPQALMAGANLSLSARFAGIGAGLDAYAQVYMRYQPFFLEAEAGVTVWLQFLGRHEVSAWLHLYSPPMGGRAEVSLDLLLKEIEFGFDFGEDRDSSKDRQLTWQEFVESMLGVPWLGTGFLALPSAGKTGKPGLLNFEVSGGRSSRQKISSSTAAEQLGHPGNEPIEVDLAFSIAARTKLPLLVGHGDLDPSAIKDRNLPQSTSYVAGTNGYLDLAMCGLSELPFGFQVRLDKQPQNQPLIRALQSHAPVAYFGSPLGSDIHPCTSDQIAASGSSDATVRTVEGFELTFTPQCLPEEAGLWAVSETEQTSQDGEWYPVPWPPLQPSPQNEPGASIPKLRVVRRFLPQTPPKAPSRRAMKAAQSTVRATAETRPSSVQPVWGKSSWLGRVRSAALTCAVTTAAEAANLQPVPLPASPKRGDWLQGVRLQIAQKPRSTDTFQGESGADAAVEGLRGRAWARGLKPVRGLGREAVIRLAPKRQPLQAITAPELRVAAGQVLHLQLGDRPLALDGLVKVKAPPVNLPIPGLLRPARWVRLMSLDGLGRPLADRHVNSADMDEQRCNVPVASGARQLVMIGQGRRSPVRADWPTGIAEPVGLEGDTRLVGLGRRSAAAHGCCVHVRAGLRERLELQHAYLGDTLLRPMKAADFLWPAMPAGCSLLLQCAPRQGRAAPTDNAAPLRWTAHHAKLVALGSRPELPWGQSFLFDIRGASSDWMLSLEVASAWRLWAVVCLPMTASAVAGRLVTGQRNWIDDTQAGSDTVASTLTLELSA